MADVSKDFKTILVLDDDPQFHRLIVPVLTSRGHRVLSAHTGKEASALVGAEEIDLVIVDGQLTDTTGIDWITEFREAGHDALLMFVSAYWRDAASYHKLTKELGVTLVLHKPILAAVFAAEVDILLGKSSAIAQASHDLEDTLLVLRGEYARELPTRFDEIASLSAQLRKDPKNDFLQTEVQEHAHKLRGTAASYGFPEIGDHAGRIEDLIIDLKKRPDQAIDTVNQVDVEVGAARAMAAKVVLGLDLPAGAQPSMLAEVAETNPIAKILVVDDDAAFLDLIDELGKQRDIEVVRASNLSDALDMACIADVDAALIDVGLGAKEAAFGLAFQLRDLPGYANLPLGFLSGSGHIEQSADLEEVGEFIYISKPMKADALQAALRQLSAIRDVTRSKVLIIDDDVDFTRRTAFVLTHDGIDVHCLNNTEDILREMQKFAPDAVLLDVMMPGVSGFDICRMLRTIPRWRDIPITFTTAYSDVDTRIACLRSGGDDYLIKPVVNEELTTQLKMQLERARQLKQRLEHDSVSGLYLRQPFMTQFAAMMSESRRQGWTTTLAFGRILTSSHDPLVSDTVLSAVGALVARRLRAEDLKGRWGSDKILLAFRNEDESTVNGLIKMLADELRSVQLPGTAEGEIAASIAFGTAQFPYDGSTVHQLVQAADKRSRDSLHPADENRVSA